MRPRDPHAWDIPSGWPRRRPWRDSASLGGWPHRRRFVRRLAIVLLVFLTLSAAGASALASWVLHRVGFTAADFGATAAMLTLMASIGVVLFAFVLALRRIGLPFGEIVAAADRVAGGDYGARVDERGPPYLRVVARAFNGMTVRLQEQDRQRRDLLADIAHELRTPLAVMQGRLEGVLDGVYPRDDAQIGELLEETRMLARLVEDLETLAHAERGVMGLSREPTDVAILIYDAVHALEPESRARHVRVSVDAAADLGLANVDPVRLREVVVNLVTNAIRHTHAEAEVVVTASQTPAWLVIRVRDTGLGIAPEDLPGIFDRFQKGPRSRGSGLGLAISRTLVEAHGGEIAAESTVGKGTVFTVKLPNGTR